MKKKKIKRIIIIILIIYYKKLYTYIHQNIMRKGGSEVTNINRKSDHRCLRAVWVGRRAIIYETADRHKYMYIVKEGC